MASRLGLIMAVLAVGVLFLSAGNLLVDKKQSPLADTQTNLALRAIGHQLLLHAGDSSSRVMPVKQLDEFTFQLEFQSPFAFVPDSLVQIVQRSLKASHLSRHYFVNVLNCYNKSQLVYGYEFKQKENIPIPCMGRIQPKDCYAIQITFPEKIKSNTSGSFYVWSMTLSVMVIVAFIGIRYKPKDKIVKPQGTGFYITLGKYAFYYERRTLISNEESIELSDKESKLLKIFASNQNHVIDREQLLKEVWEDDGVIVGRSLDVFVSRLRKKLQNDSSLRIVNIHGKGYKLETNINQKE